MNAKQLKAILRTAFPTLRKRFWSDDPITCRDGHYPPIPADTYRQLDQAVWRHIERMQLQYGDNFPDCDDFSDIKLGRFKEELWLAIQARNVPPGTAPSYGVADGYNPGGGMHDWNIFVADGKVWVSDYGNIVGPDGYKPLKVRF